MKKVLFIFTLMFFTSSSLKLFATDNFNNRINSLTLSAIKLNTNVNNINLNFSNQSEFQLTSDFNVINENFNNPKLNETLMAHKINPLDYKVSAYAITPTTKRADPITRVLVGSCAGLVAAAVLGGKDVSGGALVGGAVIGGVLGYVVWQVSTDDIKDAFK